mmetsp:Transcript_16594/g.31358  ORF Transcript_16594/g.31358 Transcript_16594/m.31358 type:complete len:347 (+) Transcript_16594:37-1077(+)
MKKAVCAWCLVASACGLSVEQRPISDASNLLTAQDDSAKVGASLLEVADGTVQGRQERVDTLLSAEQSALLSQEQALEQIAAQQAALAQQQQELKEREAKVEQEISHKSSSLDASFAQVSATSSSGSSLQAGVQMFKHVIQKTWKEQLISAAIYMAIICAAGWLYGQYCTYEYGTLRTEPKIARDSFSFSLCDGCFCDPDHRICLWACCFLPIRWADTASSPKVNFMKYWPGILTMTVLLSLVNLSYGITMLLALILMVLNRQRIRSMYNLPNRTCSTCSMDFLTWLFCPPCAAMQEAMQVEFIDSPMDATVPSMMQMNPMNSAFLTAPATGQLAAGQRRQQSSCC